MSVNLMTPILRGGTRSTNFVNGRVLTGEDLKAEQIANHTLLWQLGQALGEGVVRGLQVQVAATGGNRRSLFVFPGAALNRSGQMLVLPGDPQTAGDRVELILAQPKQPRVRGTNVFEICQPPENTAVPTGRGLYILTIYPASGFAESAPKVGLRSGGVASECDSRFVVEGVQFRLVQFSEDDLDGLKEYFQAQADSTDIAIQYRLRSLLAHFFLDTPNRAVQRATLASNLSLNAIPPTSSPLDQLRAAACAPSTSNCLMDCEVPLALLLWTRDGIRFVDMPAVRRGITRPPASHHPPHPALDRRMSEGESAYLQFQTQLQDMLNDPRLASSTRGVRAREHFSYLPAAGFLPVAVNQFQADIFFEEINTVPGDLDMAFLSAYLHNSFLVDPVDLEQQPTAPLLVVPVDGASNLLFFMRSEVLAVASQPSDESGEQPAEEPESRPGRFIVGLSAGEPPKGKTRNEFLDQLRQRAAREKVGINIPRKASVVAVNKVTGRTYHGKAITTGSTIGGNVRDFVDQLATDQAVFLINGLPAGDYTVKVSVTGFRAAEQVHNLPGGGSVTVRFNLVPEKGGSRLETVKPEKHADAGWLKQKHFEKMYPIEKRVRWPWPPRDAGRFEEVGRPPDEVLDWARDYGEKVRASQPEIPMDMGDVRVVVDKNYTGETVAAEPYAYLVYGAGGAYIPLVLTPVYQSLDREVSVTKAGIPGVDQDMATKLREDTGIESVDVLASSWSGLVQDSLDLDQSSAGGLIQDTRQRVDALQGSLEIFSGVNAGIAASLKQAGINSAVDLANTSSKTLAQTLSANGVTEGFAQRLVTEARAVVPAENWSLTAGVVGFKENEAVQLAAQGIETQGQLKAAAANQAANLAGMLNIAPALLASITNNINLAAANQAMTTSRLGAAPVTRLAGVNTNAGNDLARAGINTVAELADVKDVNILAGKLNIDAARATELVQAAKGKIGRLG